MKTRRYLLIIASLIAFVPAITTPVSAKESPVTVRAALDPSPRSLARDGWATAQIVIQNTSERAIEGALIVRGFTDMSPPHLVGERLFPPLTLPPLSMSRRTIHYSRSWARAEFRLVNAAGEIISNDRNVDTVIELTPVMDDPETIPAGTVRDRVSRQDGHGRFALLDRSLLRRIRSNPPFGIFVILLGAFAIIIVPGTYLVLGRMRRRELTWIVLPSFGVALTIAILVIGGIQNGWRDRIIVYDVVHGPGSGDNDEQPLSPSVRREIFIGVFSGRPGAKVFDISNVNAVSPVPGADLSHGVFVEKGDEAGAISVTPGSSGGVAVDLPLLFWSGRSFRCALIETDSSAPVAFDPPADAERFDFVGNGGRRTPQEVTDLPPGAFDEVSEQESLYRAVAGIDDPSTREVQIADGLSPDIVLPTGIDVVEAKRLFVRRRP